MYESPKVKLGSYVNKLAVKLKGLRDPELSQQECALIRSTHWKLVSPNASCVGHKV